MKITLIYKELNMEYYGIIIIDNENKLKYFTHFAKINF